MPILAYFLLGKTIECIVDFLFRQLEMPFAYPAKQEQIVLRRWFKVNNNVAESARWKDGRIGGLSRNHFETINSSLKLIELHRVVCLNTTRVNPSNFFGSNLKLEIAVSALVFCTLTKSALKTRPEASEKIQLIRIPKLTLMLSYPKFASSNRHKIKYILRICSLLADK